jgi:LuxR family glucitol operon transcriptional activator
MKSWEQTILLLFTAIEKEITSLLKEELLDEEFWPSKVIEDAKLQLLSDPRSGVGERNFIDYLYFQQKIEAIARNEKIVSMTPRGESFVTNLQVLLGLNGIRNDVAHPKPFSEEDVLHVVELCRDLVQTGLGESEISRILLELTSEGLSIYPQTSLPVSSVLNNLPKREYDDTGFVGRNKLIGQVVGDLKSKTSLNSFIWLTGLGGFGKTAIAREVAERLLWDKDQPFEAIIWVSFKTHELTAKGINQFTSLLISASQMIQEVPLLSDSEDRTLRDLFEELGQLETLLIFDNCETYPGEIEEIVEAQPPNSVKFLFTSRLLGEFGRNVSVDRMAYEECKHFLSKLNRTYPSPEVFELLSNQAEFEKVLEIIGKAPLGIKWMARACNMGTSLETVIQERDALVRYCVENVYARLSDPEKRVLKYLLISRSAHSIGDLKVLMDDVSSEELLQCIREVSRVGLVKLQTTEFRKVYAIDEITRDFLVLTDQVSQQERSEVEKLIRNVERASSNGTEIAFSPYRVDGKEVEPYVHGVLTRLLKRQKNSPSRDDLIEQAKEMISSAPKYWETYRVLGEMYSWFGEIGLCVEMHERAIEICPKDRPYSLSRLHYLLSQKLIAEGDAENACSHALESLNLHSCYQTMFLYGRTLVYCKRYEEAEDFIEKTLSMAGTSINEFYAHWELFKVHKRRCEDAKGNELLESAIKALHFWLSNTQLMWDCPTGQQVLMFDDVLWVVASLCLGLQSIPHDQISLDLVADSEKLLIRFDDVMCALGFAEWPSLTLKEKYRKPLLESLNNTLHLFDGFPDSLNEKINRGIDLSDVNPKLQVSAKLKIWYADKSFGFITVNLDEKYEDVFFSLRALKQTRDELKLIDGKPQISGDLSKGEKGYYLTNVIVD